MYGIQTGDKTMRSWKQLREQYWKLINKQRALQRKIDKDTLAIYVKSRTKEEMVSMLRDTYFETTTMEDDANRTNDSLKKIKGVCRYAKRK